MKPLGIILVVLGALALIYGGINYTRQRTVIDMGPLKATATEHRNLPISPIVGAVALVGGLLLIVAQQRKA